MASGYIILAILMAVTLNSASRWARAAGTGLAALALVMISASIVLANFDGTFAAYRPASVFAALTPALLDIQAVIGLVAAAGLSWAAWRQTRRATVAPLPLGNSASTFGLVSRLAHWTTAVLIACLVPMGLFLSTLPPASSDRAAFLQTHQTLGLLIIPLAVARLAWLLASPPPKVAADLVTWQRNAAKATHAGLYGLILAFPVSGVLMGSDHPRAFFGWAIPAWGEADSPLATGAAFAHDKVLPFLFYAMIALHLGAVLKHHFVDRRLGHVRRMAR